MSKKITINPDDFIDDISSFEISVAKCIKTGVLPDGRQYQLQLIITTDEDEFVDED